MPSAIGPDSPATPLEACPALDSPCLPDGAATRGKNLAFSLQGRACSPEGTG